MFFILKVGLAILGPSYFQTNSMVFDWDCTEYINQLGENWCIEVPSLQIDGHSIALPSSSLLKLTSATFCGFQCTSIIPLLLD